MAEAVLKRERTRFSSVALPFPSCCQANTARSEGSICEETMFSMRFHTALAERGRPPPYKVRPAQVDPERSVVRSRSLCRFLRYCRHPTTGLFGRASANTVNSAAEPYRLDVHRAPSHWMRGSRIRDEFAPEAARIAAAISSSPRPPLMAMLSPKTK